MADWRFQLRSFLVFPAYPGLLLKGGGGILVFAGLLVFLLEGRDIERSIERGVQEAISVPGMERVDVQVSGRHVLLDGEVATRAVVFRALDLTAGAPGVRTVAQEIAVRPVRLAYLRITEERAGYLTIEGELPSEKQARQLVELAVSTIRHRRLHSELQVNPEVTAPVWFDILPVIFGELKWLEGIELEIGAGQVAVGGLAGRRSQYSVLVARIREFLSRYDMKLVNRIGIYAPDDA